MQRRTALALFLLPALMAAASLDVLKKELKWRSIGPYRGGRSTAVAGVVSQPNVFYFGATGGGVWKSTDSGMSWDPISDHDFTTGSVGAIAVADSDPNVVYVGMGEEAIRGNVSHGDGMYKSTDAGKTWKKIGLADTRQISRVRVHPRNPDLVYVAALGHTFGPNEERGVFRSSDGGKSWKKILYRGPKAGAVDLVFDPTNANVLYAAFWEASRTPWSLESGGPGSGIWKSTDGGDNWTDITRATGLPKGVVGRIGIAVSPANSDRVWALVEADDGGVFRSDNAGKTWTRTNEQRMLRQRAWYYTRIYADPKNADTMYVLNTGFYRSNDAGRTFTAIRTQHGDNHDLWIAPDDPQRMIEANDGGVNVTQNGGRSWTEETQPTAQFYRVALDNDFPYNIYGAQQDNSTVRIASRTTGAAIDERAWYEVGGGESGWIAPHPKDSAIVFAGSYGGLITRYDHHTGQLRNVTPWPDNPMGHPAADLKQRFQWNFPLLFAPMFSPNDTPTLYAASQMLFKSTNEGKSWEIISPDLTRNDRSKQGSSGGPITKDNTSIEYYCTIFTVAESPVKRGVIWTGSDDGLVQVTENGGGKWTNVTPKDMPEWIQINSIEASPHDPASAYFAGTMYKSDDYRPYLYKTNDYGKTWKKIINGIPDGAFTRVIREDPTWKGTLYAGTETGVYVSFDDGANWQSLQMNLPVVPIHDLAIHKREHQLVAATHGRSFWILDDLSLLHQSSMADVAAKDAHLFTPEVAYRMPGGGRGGSSTVGQNPAAGVVVYYNLKSKPAAEMTLEFLDASGALVKKFSTKDAATPAGPAGGEDEGEGPRGGGATRLPADAGLNRFVWDMRYADASRFPGLIMWAGSVRGPLAVPGAYQVRLTVDGKSLTEKFAIQKDPRLAFTDADYSEQLKLLLQIRDKLSAIHDGITRIREARKQVDELSARWKDDPSGKKIVDAGKSLNDKMKLVEETLYQTKNQSSQDPLNYPIRLNNRLAALAGVVAEGDGAPTAQSYVVLKELLAEIDPQLKSLDDIMRKDLDDFNKTVRDANLPAVMLKAK